MSEVAGREKTMKLAKEAADKAEELKGQRDTARRERRLSEKKLAKSRAATAKLKNGGRFFEKRSSPKLPKAVRARVEAAEADTVAAGVLAEARQ